MDSATRALLSPQLTHTGSEASSWWFQVVTSHTSPSSMITSLRCSVDRRAEYRSHAPDTTKQRYAASFHEASSALPEMLVVVPIVIDGEEYMDRAELARHLNVGPSTISAWASRDKMPPPARYIGRSPLWLVVDIDAWQDSRPGKGWRSQLPADVRPEDDIE